jgi:hypothetical protein
MDELVTVKKRTQSTPTTQNPMTKLYDNTTHLQRSLERPSQRVVGRAKQRSSHLHTARCERTGAAALEEVEYVVDGAAGERARRLRGRSGLCARG